MIMSSFCFIEGFALMIASRFALVLEPRNLEAILERLSPSTATYGLVPAGSCLAEAGEALAELPPIATRSSPCWCAASRNAAAISLFVGVGWICCSLAGAG